MVALVHQPGGFVSILEQAVVAPEMNFLAVVFECQRHDGVLRGAVARRPAEVVMSWARISAAIGRPAEGINDVTERRVAAREFFALQQRAVSSVFLQPDVVALQNHMLG